MGIDVYDDDTHKTTRWFSLSKNAALPPAAAADKQHKSLDIHHSDKTIRFRRALIVYDPEVGTG